jgi:hypothetical protein
VLAVDKVAGLFAVLSALDFVPVAPLFADTLEALGAAAVAELDAAGATEAADLDCAAAGPAEAHNKTKPKYTTCQYRIIDPLVLAGRIESKTMARAPRNSSRANSNH